MADWIGDVLAPKGMGTTCRRECKAPRKERWWWWSIRSARGGHPPRRVHRRVVAGKRRRREATQKGAATAAGAPHATAHQTDPPRSPPSKACSYGVADPPSWGVCGHHPSLFPFLPFRIFSGVLFFPHIPLDHSASRAGAPRATRHPASSHNTDAHPNAFSLAALPLLPFATFGCHPLPPVR